MKQNTSTDLFLYWNRLREGRPAPTRSQIEPSDIRRHLADTFILEARPNGAARFRLAGTRLCAVFGHELKGLEFGSLFPEKDGRMAAALIQTVVREASVVVAGIEGHSRNERKAAFELLLLPLASENGDARILGSLSAIDRPFWLGADPVMTTVFSSVRIVDPDREPMYLKNRPEIPVPPVEPNILSFAPWGNTGTEGAASSRRVAHLRVYEGGKPEKE